METTLLFSQIIFNFVISLAIIMLGIFLGVTVYHLSRIAKNLYRISENVAHMSEETEERLKEILENLADMPFFSLFMKRPRKRRESKSRPVS